MKKNLLNTYGRLAAVLVLLLLIVVLGLSRGAVQSMRQHQASPIDDPQVQKLNEMLQRTDLSPESRRDLEERRIMAERMALERVDPQPGPVEQRGPKIAPPLSAPLLVEPTQELWEGVFEGSDGLVRPSAATVINGWQGRRARSDYQVFAGSTPEEPVRGLLIVAQMDDGTIVGGRTMYLAPDGITSLTIIEMQDTTLLLETDSKSRLYFDLMTRQFQPAE